jgi:hypothetical protein
MSDRRRVYSDAEFAIILRRAAELASAKETLGHASGGLTLADMKAAAAEVGINPALVERAARLLPAKASPSVFERLIGGPLRHGGEIHVPTRMDEARAARLLAAVQISAGQPGNGHSSSIGMVWHARDEMESLSVSAQPGEGGTSVAVHLDRRGTLALVQVAILIGFAAAAAAGLTLSDEVAPAAGVAAGVGGSAGILALARSYWTTSTRQVRLRIGGVMDAICRVVDQSEIAPSASGAIDDPSDAPGIPADTPGGAR